MNEVDLFSIDPKPKPSFKKRLLSGFIKSFLFILLRIKKIILTSFVLTLFYYLLKFFKLIP